MIRHSAQWRWKLKIKIKIEKCLTLAIKDTHHVFSLSISFSFTHSLAHSLSPLYSYLYVCMCIRRWIWLVAENDDSGWQRRRRWWQWWWCRQEYDKWMQNGNMSCLNSLTNSPAQRTERYFYNSSQMHTHHPFRVYMATQAYKLYTYALTQNSNLCRCVCVCHLYSAFRFELFLPALRVARDIKRVV